MKFQTNENGLTVELPAKKTSDIAIVLKIK
jgi:hypothetical protein